MKIALMVIGAVVAIVVLMKVVSMMIAWVLPLLFIGGVVFVIYYFAKKWKKEMLKS